jgi:hypothetical protein
MSLPYGANKENPMNTTKPWLPDYEGPNEGWALWVSHDSLLEYCTDFAARIAYCEYTKPATELPLRRRALTLIPTEAVLPPIIESQQAAAHAQQACSQARLAYEHAWKACSQARHVYEQTRHAGLQSQQEDDHARQAYILVEQAADYAEQVYLQAWKAYGLTLVARYAPDIPHINGALLFEET